MKQIYRWMSLALPLALFALLASTSWAAQTTSANLAIIVTSGVVSAFYVAPNGSDSNPGTLASPFATVNRCQTAMRASGTVKTCYLRGGPYTGSGVGYNTVTTTTYFSVTEALYLTSLDNGETFSYYPPDGYNSAVFDGGASSSNTGVNRGFYIDGGSNITVNGLQFRFFSWSGISIHGGKDRTSACEPTFPGNANGNLIENNIVHDVFPAGSQCSGGFAGSTGAIDIFGQALNNTVSHNVVYNSSGMGIRSGSANDGTGNQPNDNISGTIFDHNVVLNTSTGYNDTGAIYMQDGTANSTGLQQLYNYVRDYGQPGFGASAGQNSHAYYDDDGASNVTRTGNVATGLGSSCFFQHGGGNVTDSGNICDEDTANGQQIEGYQTSVGTQTGITYQHNIDIAKAASCSGQCTYGGLPNAMNPTINTDGYWNFGSGGTNILGASAGSNGDSAPNNVNPSFLTCPGGGLDSWGFVLNGSSTIFNSPVTFPAQPAGWGTPGFWGPPGYVIPHSGTAPSYGPTC